MLREFSALGYKKIITTPHVVNDYYPNTKERILGQMYNLQDAIEENNIDVELVVSGEYRLEPAFLQKLENDELIPFGEEKYILVEMPFFEPNYSLEDFLPAIRDAGYQPILAHPERHSYLSVAKLQSYSVPRFQGSKVGKVNNFNPVPERSRMAGADKGLLLQLNMLSLVGRYGRSVQKKAERLVKEGVIDFVGSDGHSVGDLEELRKVWGRKSFLSLVESGCVRNSEL